MEYDFPLQKVIIESKENFKLLNGVPGSLKTLTLVKQVVYDTINVDDITDDKIIEKDTPFGIIKTYDVSKFTEDDFKKCKGCINTLTGSVTEEIKSRLEDYLNIEFYKKNSHYIYSNDFISINISSMDGFIHTQLMSYNAEVLDEMGDYYDEKALQLDQGVKDGRLKNITTKTKDECTNIYSDEFQDMKYDRCSLLINICLRFPQIKMNIYGDILQTIYTHSIKGPVHPMNQWKNDVGATEYNNNICFRCPPSHLKLLEVILKQPIYFQQSAYDCYNVPVAIPSSESFTIEGQVNTKPILFTHPSTSNNVFADIIADQITSSIACLMGYDSSVKPGDICILMKKCNNNHTFHKIYEKLEVLYNSMGYSNKIKIFETQGDGSHNKIDWSETIDSSGKSMKTVMISIHGDKGKGHKVVYFIGLSEKSLPLEKHIYKPEELAEVSALNVGMTRSTKYLFVGFNSILPSRYIKELVIGGTQCEIIKQDLAVCSWNNKSNIPEGFYSDNVEALISPWRKKNPDQMKIPKPMYSMKTGEKAYKEEPVYMPIDPTISISKIYEELNEPEKIIKLEKRLVFDSPIKCKFDINKQCLQPIMGNLGEILYIREHLLRVLSDEKELFEQELYEKLPFLELIENDAVYYTENTDLINIVYDRKLNSSGSLTRSKYEEILKDNKNNKELIEDLKCVFDEEYSVILPRSFNNQKIIKSIESFTKYKKTDKIHIIDIWNIALIFSIVNDDIYKPCLNVFLNNPPIKDIKDLLTNISLIQDYLKIDDLDFVSYQSIHKNTKTIKNQEFINRLGKGGCEELTFGLHGISDMIDIKNKTLYDIKVPMTDTFNNGWISQVTGYLVTDIFSRKISTESFRKWNKGGIIDITNGRVWKFYYDFKHKSKKEIFKHILEIHDIDDSVVSLF